MVAFNQAKGEASKSSFDQFQYKMGENRFRLFGDLLPRYVYWVKGENNKDIPMECLSFDRDLEKFVNKEHDHVRDYFPDLKCTWAYVINGIDLSENKPVVVNLKKKLFGQIQELASQMKADPTDIEEGFDVVFTKKKTGPNVYNVEYTVQAIDSLNSKRPLTDAEREMVAQAPSIEDVLPRPTPDAQKELLQRITQGDTAVDADAMDEEFDVS